MQSDVFSVIADPTRRHIVHLLAEQTRTVGAIVEDLNMSQPTISKHLKILRETGAATVLVEGQRRLYSLNPEVFDEITAWIADIQAIAQSTKAQRESQVKRAVALDRDVEDVPAESAGSSSSQGAQQSVLSESAESVSDQKVADGEAASVKDLQGLKPAVKTENAVHTAAVDAVAEPEAAEKDQEPGQQEQDVSSRDAGASRTTDAHVSAIQNSAARISARSSAASGKAAEPVQERQKVADSAEDQAVESETAAQKSAGRHAEQKSVDEKSGSPQAADELTEKNADSSVQNADVQDQVGERASSTEEETPANKDGKPHESADRESADTQTSPEGSSESSEAVTEPAPVTSPQERASRTLSQGKRFDAFPGSTGSSKPGVKAGTAQEGSSSAQSSAAQDQIGTDQTGAGDSRVPSASTQGSEAEGTDESAAKKKTTTAAIAKPAIFDDSQAAEHTHTSSFVPKESTSSAARIVSKPAPSPAPVTSADEPEEDEVIPLRPFTPSGSSYQEEKPAQAQSYGYDDGVADGQQDFSAQDGGFTALNSSAEAVQSGEDTQPEQQAEQAQSETPSREQNRVQADAAAEADTPVQPQEVAKTETAKAQSAKTHATETSTLESPAAEISTPSTPDAEAPKAETLKTETSVSQPSDLQKPQSERSEQARSDHEAAQPTASGTYGLDDGQPSRAGENPSASAQTRPAAQQFAALSGQKPGESAAEQAASEEPVTEPAAPAAATAKTAVSETAATGGTAAKAPATEAKPEDAQPASTLEQGTVASAPGEGRKAEQTQVQQEQKLEDSDSSGSAETPETIEAKLARNAPVSSESVTFTAVLPVVTPEDSTLQGATPPEEDEDSARAADQPETQESEKKQSNQTQKLPYQTQTEYTSAFGTADSPKEAARGLLSRVFGRRR